MLCPGCFQEKGENISLCPYCEFDEAEQRSPLVLPLHTVLNKQYIVGRVLGKPGGFGITYLGWDSQLETLVAIKEYLPRDLAGRQYDHLSVTPHTREDVKHFKHGLEQFLQEARTMAKINHPNVVRVRNFFTENETAYLVMDFYEGVALSEYLTASGGKIAEPAAAGIMIRVLDGLKEIHDRGFLHRDIKPHNIYLTVEGKPILLDLGAARDALRDKDKSLSVLYSSGFTPFEQYYRRGDQGTWTDIYACGATLYYMLTGVVPPDAPGRLAEDELVYPSQLEPSLSSRLSEVIYQSLAMDPSKRPQTAQDFQNLLLAVVEGTEEQWTPPGADQRPNAAVPPVDSTQTGAKGSPVPIVCVPEHTASSGQSRAALAEAGSVGAPPVFPAGTAAGLAAAVLDGTGPGTVGEDIRQVPAEASSAQLPGISATDGPTPKEAVRPQTLKERILGNRRLWLPGLLIALGICLLVAVFAYPDRQRAGVEPQQFVPAQQPAETAVKGDPPQNAPGNTAIPAAGSGEPVNSWQPVSSSGESDETNDVSDKRDDASQEYKAPRTKAKSSGDGPIHFVEPKKPGVTMDRNTDP